MKSVLNGACSRNTPKAQGMMEFSVAGVFVPFAYAITAINIDRAPKPNHESPEVYRYSANEPSPQMQPGPAITSKQRPRLEDSRHKHDMLVELQGTQTI